jgi:IstB-like ATP binding protein
VSGEASAVTADNPQVLLEHHLKTLRLPTILREYDKVARQCSIESVDYPRYLLRMTELELLDRERRATERRIQQARFPVVKRLDSFEFLALPSLNKALVLELARCEFLQRRENVLLLGNSGTGKTHVALALGLAACQRGHRVRFTTTAALVHELMEARDEKRLLRFQKQMARYELLIVDRSAGLGAADWRAAGPAHPPRTHPGDERRKLPPQAEQTQTQLTSEPLTPCISKSPPCPWPATPREGRRLPLRPKRGPGNRTAGLRSSRLPSR